MAHRYGNNVFVLAREPCLRRLLGNLLQRYDGSVSYFSGQEDCLRRLSASLCDLLIIDCEGCATDGLRVLARATQMPLWIPAIVVVDAGDIPQALHAMKLGAFDCLETPVNEDLLLSSVESGLSRRRLYAARWKVLTKTEARVLQLILAGKTAGEIAGVLRRSERTVEVHRASIMRKLNVHRTADLVRWAMTAGIIGPERAGVFSGSSTAVLLPPWSGGM